MRASSRPAAAADGADLVIVWGGDGTVNEAGSALVGSRTALGLVPAGSGNGLAASLVRAPRVARGARASPLPRRRAIDVGFLGKRPFFNIAGIGLDAHIATEFNRAHARPTRQVAIHRDRRARRLALPRRSTTSSISTASRSASPRCSSPSPTAPSTAWARASRRAPSSTTACSKRRSSRIDPALARFVDARHLALRTIARAPKVPLRPGPRGSVSRPGGPMLYHVDGEPGVAHRGVSRPDRAWRAPRQGADTSAVARSSASCAEAECKRARWHREGQASMSSGDEVGFPRRVQGRRRAKVRAMLARIRRSRAAARRSGETPLDRGALPRPPVDRRSPRRRRARRSTSSPPRRSGAPTSSTTRLREDPTGVRRQSYDGWTPLHLAAFFGHAAMVTHAARRAAPISNARLRQQRCATRRSTPPLPAGASRRR